MASKYILSFFLIFSSFLRLGFSQLPPNLAINPAQLPAGNIQCVEKLAPCQPYLKLPPSGTPPPTCCQPLKDMITKDTDCLCTVLNDPEMLQSMNVTKDDALKLPKACGLEADVSKCKKDASSPASSPSSGSNSAPADSDERGSNSKSSTGMITPYGANHFGVCSLTVLMFALVLSAY